MININNLCQNTLNLHVYLIDFLKQSIGDLYMRLKFHQIHQVTTILSCRLLLKLGLSCIGLTIRN